MMHHRRIQNQLSAYIDDELSPEARVRVEAHLGICDECAQTLAEFQRNRQWIATLEHAAPPICELVLSQLPDRGPAKRKFLPDFSYIWSQWVLRPATGGVFALALACLILATLYLHPPSDSPVEELDFYLTVHTEPLAYHPLRSNTALVSSEVDSGKPDTTTADNTEFFLDLYLGD